METTAAPTGFAHLVGGVGQLPADDLPAAEALAAAMCGWDAAHLATYRDAVLEEVAALKGRPVRGFLAVEMAALSAVAAQGA